MYSLTSVNDSQPQRLPNLWNSQPAVPSDMEHQIAILEQIPICIVVPRVRRGRFWDILNCFAIPSGGMSRFLRWRRPDGRRLPEIARST